MKIVMLRSNPVKPDPRVEKEASSLLKANHEVKVIAWDRDADYKKKESYLHLKDGEAMITRFGIKSVFGAGFRKNLIPLIKFQFNIFKWLIKNNKEYDIIHACDFDTVIPAFMASKIFKKKYVYDIFDYYVDAFNVPKKIKRFIESLDHNFINKADAVIICSEKRKKQIYGTKPKNIEIIHNSPSNIDIYEDKIECKVNNDKVKIVYVGILNDDRFICELIELIEQCPQLELHIGGFGKYQEYVEIKSRKVNNIKYYGRLEYEETLRLEKECDIMVAIYNPLIKNHYYAAPNKFYEALMLGKPLIMAKNTGMDDIIQKHNIGEVVEYNIESVKAGIFKLISRRNEWRSMGLEMNKIFNSYYSWNQMEERLVNLYDNIK